MADLRHFDDLDDPTSQANILGAREIEARAAAERIREVVLRAREVQPRGLVGIGQAGAATLAAIGYSSKVAGDEEEDAEDDKKD